MYLVYILKSINHNKTYTGITDDLERRIEQHNNGYHTYSKRYLPWTVMHVESYPNREKAREREKYLKSAAGRKWIKKELFKEA